MSRSELSQPFFAPFADGSGVSTPKETVSQEVISTLESVFNTAGVTSSNPDNPHERLLRSTGDMEGEFVGNEIFLWENGKPVLHMGKELYLKPQRDGTTYQADWLMDPGNNSPLHHIHLRTLADYNLITIGMQHPNDLSQAVEIEYLHNPGDGTALADEATATLTRSLTPAGEQAALSLKFFHYLDHGKGRTTIEGLEGEIVRESIIFPNFLHNVPELITLLEASWKDMTADPNQPWKHLLEDYGISYKLGSQE